MKKNVITRYVMTNGCPQQAKCFAMLEMILDGEGNPQDEIQFEKQMASCWHCFQKFKLDLAVKSLVQNKMERKQVPPQLVEAIKSKITKVR